MRKKSVLSILLLSSLLFTGCSGDIDLNPKKIHVDFKTFATTDTSKVNTVSVKAINLKDDRISDDNVKTISDNIAYVYDTLGEQNYVRTNIGNMNNYYSAVQGYFSDNFYNTMVNSNYGYLYKTMMNIYEKDNSGYYKTNLIELSVNENETLEATVDVMSIQDKTIYSETQKLSLTDDFKIKGIKVIQNIHNVESSQTPLYATNISDSNDKFTHTLSNFLSSISNPYLYEKYAAMKNGTMTYENDEDKNEKNNEINLQVETLLTKDGMNTEVLKTLFDTSKGKFEDYGVVSYVIRNNENKEESIYEVGFVCNKEINYYNFTYSRLLDKITNVQEVG